jgi:hypothetical protein
MAGYLVRFGFVVPFAVGAGLAVVGFVLVYTQVEETVATTDARESPVRTEPVSPASTD